MSEQFNQQYVAGSYNAVANDGSSATVNNAIYQFADPVRVPAERLDEARVLLDQMPLDIVPRPGTPAASSRLVYAHNPLFVGREDDLKQLAQALKAGGTAAIGQIAAATGLGGIGKTQLASEFVHRYGQFFAGGVYWLSFADPAGIPTEIAECSPPSEVALPLDVRIARVRASWSNPLPRLLVFDNCEGETLLEEWRPKTGGSRVLLTSRCGDWSEALRVQAFSLGMLTLEESVSLLRRLRPSLTDDEAAGISEELGRLPLALHMAGSYLKTYERVVSAAQYLEQLRSERLLEHVSLQGQGVKRLPTGHEAHVARTFALSYDRLKPEVAADILALELLRRAAWLAAGEPIPRELLCSILHPLGLYADPIVTEDALNRLIALGLLEEQQDGSLVLHRLLAVFVQGQAGAPEALDAVEQSLIQESRRLIPAGIPQPFLRWMSHFRAVTSRAGLRGDEAAADLYSNLGCQLRIAGAYVDGCEQMRRAVAISREALGTCHPETAASLNNLAGLLQAQGKLAEAEPLYREAHSINQEVLGPHHSQTAGSLNNLGYLLQAQGRFAEAEPFYREALSIRRKVLGPRHPETSISLNNLAYLLRVQGKLAEAEPLHHEALSVRREALGARHPLTAASLNNLAGLLQAQGKLMEAIPLLREAHSINEEALGSRHPQTATGLLNLADALETGREWAEAEPLYREALSIYQEVLGQRHAYTTITLSKLAGCLEVQGKLAEAEPLYREELSIHQEVLGERHSETAATLNNLACLLFAQRNLAEAEPLLREAVDISEERLGLDHPTTQEFRQNLQVLLDQRAQMQRKKWTMLDSIPWGYRK